MSIPEDYADPWWNLASNSEFDELEEIAREDAEEDSSDEESHEN